MIETLALLAVGVLTGVVLGSVGGGGSLLTVPALVYLGGQSVKAAQVGSLIVVIAAAAIALRRFLTAGEVRRRAGLAFALAAVAGSVLGTLVGHLAGEDVLLLCFSPVMAIGAAAMLREDAGGESRFQPWRYGVTKRSAIEVGALGLGVGALTGVFGVGGGFVIVPALVLALGFATREAVGTSLLVIVIASVPALLPRLPGGGAEWSILLPFLVAAAAGSVLGVRLGLRRSHRALTRWFALLVSLAAAFTAGEAVAGLSD